MGEFAVEFLADAGHLPVEIDAQRLRQRAIVQVFPVPDRRWAQIASKVPSRNTASTPTMATIAIPPMDSFLKAMSRNAMIAHRP